ncbi:Di-copper centre-containing protein [Durotheca rogersii]|uniref:Di-copper centre-containing protein n=1 Tax=Durotheca rogersii TaxID=419775 RepID=UPI00221EB333|nr:Di-copper centre-containing protein [Durotheca rogersii]KAI5862147.1 Di-copper centre-containing protein [Durotheca rogersii]
MLSVARVVSLAVGLSVATVLASFTRPRQYDYGLSDDHRLLKRQELLQSHIVTGPPHGPGVVHLRPDIRDLQKDEDKWNLYILALNWMQFTNQSSPFSWYQIAGIHGAPALTWAGVDPTPGNEDNGYCTHVSVLFPTWHRPYLALYEQVLYNIVQNIATLYPPSLRDRFQAAAATFRIPYWDWAAVPPEGESLLPSVISTSPQISVSGPNGVQTISNPLFSYIFKPSNKTEFTVFPYDAWGETKRAPRPADSPEAISNNSFVVESLDSHLPSLQQRLHNLFTNYPNYTQFSSEAWIPYGVGNNDSYDSVESLHDTIHTLGGGFYGHLAIIAYSSFDPLFWLHHTNVDRIFALWQILYNESYVVPTPAVLSSRTTSPGEVEDSQRALTPFFLNNTSFWTSDAVRDHQVFGYSYSDAANKSREQVIASINKLYGNFGPVSMLRRLGENHRLGGRRSGEDRGRAEAHRAYGLSWNSQTSEHLPVTAVFRDGRYREWMANVRVRKPAAGGGFSIHLFLGEVPENPLSWPVAPNLVGTVGVLAHTGAGDHGRSVGGTIPLTSALMGMVAAGRIPSLDADAVVPLLQPGLEVRVLCADGTTVDALEVKGLSISVASAVVRVPEAENRLSEWAAAESHFEMLA